MTRSQAPDSQPRALYLAPPRPASHMAGAQVGIREGFQKQGLLGTLTLSSPLAGGTDVWHQALSQEGTYLLCNLGESALIELSAQQLTRAIWGEGSHLIEAHM